MAKVSPDKINFNANVLVSTAEKIRLIGMRTFRSNGAVIDFVIDEVWKGLYPAESDNPCTPAEGGDAQNSEEPLSCK